MTIKAAVDTQGNGGDITVKGSEVRADQDISLEASHDVNVIGAVNTQHSDKDEKSYGGGVGISFTVGGDQSGLRFTGNANFSRERENADGSAWSEGIVEAGKNLTVKTGHDTTLVGAQLKGDSVKMDVGNNLNIASLQDTDNYDYDKLSASVSGSGGLGGYSFDLSLSKTEMNSNWASVTDQSGIFAGKNGFDVTVGNNTDLKGAVIASTAEDKSNNKLDTGTISFENIENKADFKVDSSSASIGTSGAGLPSSYHNDGSASSTTKSAVEDGTLIVRNQDEQKQNVDDLSRDTDNANNPLGQIFDKQKEQDKITQSELVKDIGNQAIKVVQNIDRLGAQAAANKVLEDSDEKDRIKGILSSEDKDKVITDNDIYEYVYNGYMNGDSSYSAMGSNVRQGIDAATSIISGLITGDMVGGLAGASGPYLATLIKENTYKTKDGKVVLDKDGKPEVDLVSNTIAHAILGGVIAELQGNSGLSGALGAGLGERAAGIIKDSLYPDKDMNHLSVEEKETINALAGLIAGLATAASGGGVSDVNTAVGGSKNAVENNSESPIFGFGEVIGFPSQTSENYSSTLHASAAGYLTQEETIQLFDDINNGKFMYDPLREDLKRLPEDIAIFTTPYGDVIAFKDAETWGDYAIAVAGTIPVVGKATKFIKIGGKVVKVETKAALTLVKDAEVAYSSGNISQANKLMDQAASQSTQVKVLDVSSYRELKKGSVVGDGLEHDHIPSFAALKTNKEKELGRKLSEAEKKQLYNEATAVEVPKDVHQAGPTYGGKNTKEQIQKDAVDLCGAVCRDTDALRQNMIQKGYEPKEVEDAINKIKDRNKEMGVY
ncbi:hemagglutinin repeat-containing protein [Orbus wheelerorum]|uniref:hemagglutinin repeat-containing protein n=1 Tax=Orbus wheelerorum TaxID=3074111 RepID=UPI00370D9795